jgi:hypothetical protein
MREIETLESSALMRRLIASTEPEVRGLAASVQSAAIESAHLLSTVVVDMPLYTLHNERHILNVIGWMEHLLGHGGIEGLSMLECAVSILAAYTHDLGMTLGKEERDALPRDPDYLRFRERYGDERHLIDALRRNAKNYRADLIENHLRTEYLKMTHADLFTKRLGRRLRLVMPHCVYQGLDYLRHLELVAVSHNQPVEWLRLQSEREGLSWRETVGRNEPVANPPRASLPFDPKAARLPHGSLPDPKVELASASLVLETLRARARFNASFHYPDSDYKTVERLMSRDRILTETLYRAPKNARSRTRARGQVLGRSLATDSEFAKDLALDLARGLARERAPNLYGELDASRGKFTGYTESRHHMLHANWLQEAFFPDLTESWPGTGLQGLQGRVGDGALTAPATFHFELNDKKVVFADPRGMEPPDLARYQYDICFPMSAVPIGELRRSCTPWREDRRYRALGVLPFLLPHLFKTWKAHALQLREIFLTDRIYACWPAERLRYKPFKKWSPADWQDDKHRSLLWNIGDGSILVAEGVLRSDEIRTAGNLMSAETLL